MWEKKSYLQTHPIFRKTVGARPNTDGQTVKQSQWGHHESKLKKVVKGQKENPKERKSERIEACGFWVPLLVRLLLCPSGVCGNTLRRWRVWKLLRRLVCSVPNLSLEYSQRSGPSFIALFPE
ncbi:hypothetical protein DY000_02025034 [Brassica cretica]|uniref:Uncharacterized protein n=1 Tax=Brassica cretica TaxID=69181 RepID=A0ABQ7ELC4_BRACR|nr:hypothetical protein DY000_02025034 [Brassica cretica]